MKRYFQRQGEGVKGIKGNGFDLPTWRIDNLWAFLISLIISIFSFASLYFSLTGDIRSMKQDIAYIKERIDKHIELSLQEEKSFNDLSLKVQTLDANQKIVFNKLGLR